MSRRLDRCRHPHRAGHQFERRARGTTRLSGVRVALRRLVLVAGPAREWLADGEPDRFRCHGHPTGPDAGRRVADHDQGSGRREQRDRQDDHHHDGLGRVGDAIPRGRGARRLRDHRGEREHQHRAFCLRAKAWRAAPTPVSRRSPARSTPNTTAPTTPPPPARRTAGGTPRSPGRTAAV